MPSSDRDASMLCRLACGASHEVLDAEAWERVAERSIEERLAPLIYWKQKNDPSLPRVTAQRLRAELYRTSAVNQILLRELSRYLRAASSRGLTPPIVLKGAALSATVYDDIALRPMGDVDLLVPQGEVDAFVSLARELGYRPPHPEMALGLREGLRYHVALEKSPQGTAKLEIHWQLVAGDADSRAPDIAWFRERWEPWRPPRDVDRRAPVPSVRALRPTPLLLYLAAHAILQHGVEGAPLIWLHDIHLVATRRAESIDWIELLARAEQLGWRDALELALARSEELFATALPEPVREALGAASSSPAATVPEPPGRTRAEWVWRELSFLGFRERLRLILAILFPRPAYVKWRYPSAGRLWPACYAYRWSVVVLEAARAIARRRDRTTPSRGSC